jgi:hypothetical protein
MCSPDTGTFTVPNKIIEGPSMKNKTLSRSVLVALVLTLAQYGIGFVARQFYQQSTGRMTGDIQRHNIMVAENADWVFTFIVAGVWVFLYLRDHRPGYRRLCIEIATTFGIFTLIGMVRSIVTLLLSPELQGTLSANIAWIAMVTPLSFIKTAVLTGFMAAAVIAVINRLRPMAKDFILKGTEPSADSTTPVVPPEITPAPLPGETAHPLFPGVVVGGASGLLLAGAFVLLPKIIGRGMELVMLGLLPLGLMYQEFMSFDPFIPEIFRGHEKAYADIMALLALTSLGIIVASISFYNEARCGKRASLGRLLGISVCTGAAIAAMRVAALLILAPKYTGGILGTPIAWITGAILLGLIIAGLRNSARFRTIPSLTAPLAGSRLAPVMTALLVVVAMIIGQGMDIKERQGLNVFTKKHDKEQQQRESSEGLLIDQCDAHWDACGDLIVTGLVTNTTGLNKAWFIDAKTLDKSDKVLTTAKMVDGRQHFSLQELELLSKVRHLPECVIRAPERQLAAKSTSRFELRMIQPPPEAVSYSLALKPPPYNEMAANDLQDMKGSLEKQYAEMGKNGGKLPQGKAVKILAGRKQLDELGINVFLGANYTTDLEATKKEEIFRRRQMEIDRYRDLEIFPADYISNKSIFGQIDDKIGWLQDTPLFLMNPYLLVIEAGGEYVNGIFAYCPMSSLTYSPKRITISYEKESAKKWRHYINDYYQDSKGVMRLWFVNAMDAGFSYAHVDPARSENVEPVPGAPADHVMIGVYSPTDFFHVGRKGKNNISPNDAKAKLKLKDRNAKTTIYVKLWRKKPVNSNAPEDFSYVIDVAPGV